jgi:hypothetical protein
MNREALIELAFQQTTLDGDVIDGLTDTQLLELLGLQPVEPVAPVDPIKPAKPRKRRARKQYVKAPKIERVDFVIGKDGSLVRKMTLSDESITYVRCGERVTYEGKQVSASIVLHWLKTGEWVDRAPKIAKPFRAVIREGRTVKHIGRYATEEERNSALVNYHLGFVPNN